MATPAYLTPQTVTIPLRAGLDKKTSDKAVNPPQLLAAENCNFDTPGEIKKDRPYQPTGALPNSIDGVAVPSPIYRVFGSGPRRSMFAKNSMYDVRDNGRSSLVCTTTGGYAPSTIPGDGVCASTSAEPLSELPANRSSTLYDVDYAYANGFEIIVRSNFAGSFDYAVRERETKAIIYHGTVATVAAAGTVRCVGVNNRWVVVVWPDTSLNCKYIAVDTTALPAALATVNVSAADLGANHCIDVAADSADNSIWVAYHSTSGGNAIRVAKDFLIPGTNTSAVIAGANPNGGSIGIGVSPSGTRALVAWCNTASGMNVATFTATVPGGAPTFVATNVENAAATNVKRIGVCDFGDGGVTMATVYENATAAPTLVTCVTTNIGTALSNARRLLYDYQLSHKPFVRDSLLYFGIGFTEGYLASNTQNYYATAAWNLVTNGTNMVPVAWYLCGPACVRQNPCILPNVSLDGAEYRWLGTERTQIAKQNALGVDFAALLSLQSMRFDDGNAVPLYDTFAIPGNAVRDREGLIDVAFQFAPTIASIAYSGGGALVAGQTYEWVATYESVDSYGNVQRSLPSLPVSGTVSAGNSRATVTVSAPFTRLGNQVYLVLYRSQAGLGAPHTRSQEQFLGAGNYRSGAASVALVDGTADATIATYQRLYTDDGQLPNYPPPMGRHWAIHQNRIWSINEHTLELRYTKILVSGESPGWHPNQTVPLATDRVRAWAIVSSPGGLWVLGQDTNTGAGAIAIVVGNGPGDDGNGATYEVQRLEGNNAGCSSANAVVSTPAGVMFEDSKLGIHLLPSAGGGAQAIGLPVEALRTGKTLVRAVLLQDRHEVRFVYSTGFMLCFDYVVAQWFSRQLVGAAYSIVDTCVWDGAHVVADSTLGPLTQVASGKDALSGAPGTYVPTRLTTGWIKLADFEGLQRVWDIFLLGTAYDFMGLAVSISYDFDDTVIDTHTYLDTDLPSSGALELRIPLRKQSMTAFKISVLDSQSASGTTHLGFGLVGIKIDYGVVGRGNRLRPARVKG